MESRTDAELDHQLGSLTARGIPCDEALRRIELGDGVFDCADALTDAVELVQGLLCESLDGPYAPCFAIPEDCKDAMPELESAWAEFQAVIGEAQRMKGEA